MKRDFYSDAITTFRTLSPEQVLGHLAANHPFAVQPAQRQAWLEEIDILQQVLSNRDGYIHFEYAIPRMGKRIDVVVIIGPAIFVLEFKIGGEEFTSAALDQVCDYALDLKNFHESSYPCYVVPVLIATKAAPCDDVIRATPQNDKLLCPVRATPNALTHVIDSVLSFAQDDPAIDAVQWQNGRYCPTPSVSTGWRAIRDERKRTRNQTQNLSTAWNYHLKRGPSARKSVGEKSLGLTQK
jgi:hypothetical protein